MPRNSPPCRIGSAVGITALGVTRLASWALTVNLRVSRTSRKISRSENPMPTAIGALEQRAVPVCIGDEGGRILVGELLQHLPEIGLAAIDVGRTGVRVGA